MSKPLTLEDRPVRIASGVSLLLPLLCFIPLIPLGAPPGDGAELLTAMYRFGVAHPSGYPLFTLLGAIASPLMLGEAHFNAALLLCALPTALTSWLLFRAQHHLRIHWLPALLSCLSWALAAQSFIMATRLEVYALHALLFVGVLYAMLRYGREPESPKWLVGAAVFVALGLAHHLLILIALPAVALHAFSINWRIITDWRALIAILLTLLSGVLLYLYLPLAAYFTSHAAPIWGGIASFEQLVLHLGGEGAESRFHMGSIGAGLRSIWRAWIGASMPGVPLLSALGVIGLMRREWRWTLMVVLAMVPMAILVASYTAADVALYYTPLLAPLTIFMGKGVDGLWRTVLGEAPEHVARWRALVLVFVGVGIGFNVWQARHVVAQNERVATQTEALVEELERPVVLIAHGELARPLWYHAYIAHADRERFVLVDRALFEDPSARWYREFLASRHPNVVWPAAVLKGEWEEGFVQQNQAAYRVEVTLDTPQEKDAAGAPMLRRLSPQARP